MFGIGGFELFIILLFGFLIFGPEKLPEIAKTVGKGIARFKQAQDEMNEVIKSTDIYDPNSDEPFKDPMQALDKLAKHQEEKKAAQHKPASDKGKESDERTAGGDTASQGPRQESFTERKARYERERAERKAAEQKTAEEAGEDSGQSERTAGSEAPENGEKAQSEHAAQDQVETPSQTPDTVAAIDGDAVSSESEGGER